MKEEDNRLTPASLRSLRMTKHQLVNDKCKRDGLSPILAAATNGHLDVVRCLVKNDADINDLNREGQTPLILAAKNGFHPLLRLLVNYGANLDVQDAKGRTALMHALAEGGLEQARCLIDAGANQKLVDRDGKTALFVAAECGHMAVVEQLLMDSGADLNIRDRQGRTVLMMLARGGKAWTIYKYIKESQLVDRINDRDAAGFTPLLHAADAGKFAMSARLVSWGADAAALNANGQTAVMLACQRAQIHNASADTDFSPDASGTDTWDQRTFVSAMLERGVPLDSVDNSGRTALFYAVEHAQLEMVQHLLALKAGLLRPEMGDAKGNTILHVAARIGRESMVRYLIGIPELSGLIDETNASSDVPLRLAVMSKCLKTVNALLESGASLEKADKCRDPPLLVLACENGAEDIVELLLAKGLNPDSSDAEGFTALMAATRRGNVEIVRRLLKASAHVNLCSGKGFTALTLAVQTVNLDVCQLLLEHKADPNLLPEGKTDCKTALSIAAILGSSALICLLLKFDAKPFLRDLQDRSSLYYCVLMGKFGSLTHLMKFAKPEDLDAYIPHDGQQHTLLTIATEKGYAEIAKQLLLSQASLEAKTSLGESSLHIACRRQNQALVEMYLTFTHDFDCLRDSDHFTPLMIVCQLGNEEIAMELCSKGANVDIRTPDGYTALILAAIGFANDGKTNPGRPDRLPLVNILLEHGATFDHAACARFVDSDELGLLATMAMKTRSSGSSKSFSSSTQQASAGTQTTSSSSAKLKLSGASTIEERLKIKLQKKILEPISIDKQKTEQAKKGSLASRAYKIRDQMHRSMQSTETSMRRQVSMINKYIESCALSEEENVNKMPEMKNPDIARLYRKPFTHSFERMSENKLLREFSSRMHSIRREVVWKFVKKLDVLCRQREIQVASANGRQTNSLESLAESAIKRREKRQVPRRILYQLKYKSKSAKPSKGLRPALLKRLAVLKSATESNCAHPRKWCLPAFWENARLCRLMKSQFVTWARRLTCAAGQSESQLLGRLDAIQLEGVAAAVAECKIIWAPLPGLSCNDNQSPSDAKVRPGATRQESKLGLGRLLEKLASDGNRCSLLVRCGQHPTDMKVALRRDDREAQIELSWALVLSPFPLVSKSRRVDAVVKLSVDTGRCLWDPRELRILRDALAFGSKNDTFGQSLDVLTRRRTYHLLSSPTGCLGRPQEMDHVALQPHLSARLVAALLHAKLAKAYDGPYVFHGDDVLLYRQPGPKELKSLLGLLGPNRLKLFDSRRFY